MQQFGLAGRTWPTATSSTEEHDRHILGYTATQSNYELKQSKYEVLKKDGVTDYESTGGWLGTTEQYWLTALIPDQSTPIKAEFRVLPVDNVDGPYEVGYIGPRSRPSLPAPA